jgi:predicted DNA-binding transcriptional regulator YafY
MTKPAAMGVRFAPRKLPANDAAAYVERSMSEAPHRYEARLTLHVGADELAGRVSPHWGTVTPIDERTCEYRTGDDDLRWLGLRVVMLGVDFEVHEPPELVDHLRALALRLGRACDAGPRSAAQHADAP